VMVEFI